MKRIVLLGILSLFGAAAAAAADEAPRPENFQVLPQTSTLAPAITPYLNYQVNIAWQQDDVRRKRFEQIRDEDELLRVQGELREKLLAMLGGLPSVKTPLRPQITGRIQMDGFHIEKLDLRKPSQNLCDCSPLCRRRCPRRWQQTSGDSGSLRPLTCRQSLTIKRSPNDS